MNSNKRIHLLTRTKNKLFFILIFYPNWINPYTFSKLYSLLTRINGINYPIYYFLFLCWRFHLYYKLSSKFLTYLNLLRFTIDYSILIYNNLSFYPETNLCLETRAVIFLPFSYIMPS